MRYLDPDKGDVEHEKSRASIDRKDILRLMGYLHPYRYYLLAAVSLLVVSKAVEAYVPIYLGEVTQEILNLNTTMGAVFRNSGIVAGFLLFSFGIDTFNIWLKTWIGQNALFTLRTGVYRHIQRLPLSAYDRSSVGKLMTRTIHDIDQINLMFSESIVPLLGSGFLFISICFGAVIVDKKIAFVLALVLPPVLWLTQRFRVSQRKCYDKVRAIVSAMNGFVQEHLMGASTVRSFGLEKRERKQFSKINEEHCNVYLEAIHHFAYFFAGIDLAQSVSLIAVFVVLVLFSPPETGFQAGTYFTFSLYALMLFRPLGDLAERYNVLQSAMAASSRIFHLLDKPLEPPDRGEELQEIESIEFRDVWFAYEGEDWILKGVSFGLKKGMSQALVGMTGAGKTTIMNLLLRFYDFQKGEILINGKGIRGYTLTSLRRQFSVVLQDPEIFTGTIRDNLTLYDETLEVEPALDAANLRPIVNRFPDGVEHRLSERGKSLSAGERQLLSLGRAVVHQGSVLMLDEATSNIDTATEKMIQEALKKILKNKTALVIAHRLSTIQDMDRVIVLHQGEVAESGTHAELLRKKGIYEKLYRLQFANHLNEEGS